MKIHRVSLLLVALLVLTAGCSLFSPPPEQKPTVPPEQKPTDPLSSMSSLQQDLHMQVRAAMQQAAEQMNISIQLGSFVFASRDDFVAASALVSSFDNLVFEDPTNRVADLGLLYLALPEKARIPVGFYKLRVFILQSRAELIDSSGQSVISLPLERLGYMDGSSKPMLIASGCDVTVPYNQILQPANSQTVQVAVRFSWCDRLIH